MMRCWALLLSCLLVSAAHAVDSAPDFQDPQKQLQYDRLIHEIRCLVCKSETIADSNATLAADLRREIYGMVMAGKSDADILRFMTDRYGDSVLYSPPFTTRTWLLWMAPGLLLAIGALVAVTILRKRAKLVVSDTEEPDSTPP